jgi:uncharacterized damage-inducible protein DinB
VTAPRSAEIGLLAALLEEAYEKKAWQGPNLRGSLRGVTARQAAWRPAPKRHNVRELVVHAAYWKYAVRRMLTGEKRGTFPEKGSNWFPRSDGGAPDARAWKADLALLDAEHRRLMEAVRALRPAALARKPRGSRCTVAQLLYGVASHDVYHTGQIQLLKRLGGRAVSSQR